MPAPLPPHFEDALDHLREAIRAVEKREVDLEKAPWPEIEKSVIKLLRGPFVPDREEHQGVALGLAALFAQRLIAENRAFFFANRDAIEGMSLGFPDALVMLSPFGAVMDALSRGRLEALEDVSQDIRRSLAKVRFSPDPASGPARLTADDYQRLFDPGFLQFVALDPAKAKSTWESSPPTLAREIRDALGRGGSKLPAEVKRQLEGQIVGALDRLDPKASLIDQIERGPRVVELVGHLFAAVDESGFAPEEFWQEAALPLLFIGAPDQFPPVEQQDLDAFTQGVEPLALFVDIVPYQASAPEEGLLGVFPPADLGVPHPSFVKAGSIRMVQLKLDAIAARLSAFDPVKTKAAVARFAAYLESKAGKAPPPNARGSEMLDAAIQLLTDFRRVAEKAGREKSIFCLRRVTEAEAASESALIAVRDALRAPRIILA